MDTRVVLSGRYELRSRLGPAGMSHTWQARDLILNRDVAVKMIEQLDPDSHPDAMAAARVTHPHVARVFDYGEAELEAGRRTTFVVMELLHGTPLSEVATPMPPRVAFQIGAGIAAALAAAHAQGVIHGDVKPDNVMLTRGGVKILDFGIGTTGPAGADEGLSTDVYALGLLLCRLLTRRSQRSAPTDPASAARLLDEPTDLAAGVSAEVLSLCRRCLARNPAERPAASEVARVLSEAAGASADRTVDEALLDADEPVPDAQAAGIDVERNADTVQMAPVGIGGAIIRSPSRDGVTRHRWQRAGLLFAIGTLVVALAYVLLDSTASYRWRLPSTSGDLGSGSVVAPHIPPGVGSPRIDEPTAPPAPVFAGPRVLVSSGGEVVADCQDDRPVLLAWTPLPGFKAKKIAAGPAISVGLRFHHRSVHIGVTVICRAGVPTAEVSQWGPAVHASARGKARAHRPE